MTLSVILKYAKLVIDKRGSCGSQNLSQIRSKNKQACENAVTRLYGSCMLRVMAPVDTYLFSISTGSYKYCCTGIYCPNCNLNVYITLLNNSYILDSSLLMNCNDNFFNFSLEANAAPGDYSIQVRIPLSSTYFY